MRMQYALAQRWARFRIAAENLAKLDILRELLDRYSNVWVLVIGWYLKQDGEVKKTFSQVTMCSSYLSLDLRLTPIGTIAAPPTP